MPQSKHHITYEMVLKVWKKVLARLSSGSAQHDNAIDFFLHFNRDKTGILLCKHAFEIVHAICHPNTVKPKQVNQDENNNLSDVILNQNIDGQYLHEGIFSLHCPTLRWAYDWEDAVHNQLTQMNKKIPDFDLPNTACYPKQNDGEEPSKPVFKVLLYSVEGKKSSKAAQKNLKHGTKYPQYEYVYLPENIAKLFCTTCLPYYQWNAFGGQGVAVASAFPNNFDINAESVNLNLPDRVIGLPDWDIMTAYSKRITAEALDDRNSASAHIPSIAEERNDLGPGRIQPAIIMPFCKHVQQRRSSQEHNNLFDIRNYLGFYKSYQIDGAPDKTYSVLKDEFFDNLNLEPWFRYWDRKAGAKMHCGRQQKCDLILEMEYETELGPQQRLLFLEADGQQKTDKSQKGAAKMALKDWQTMSLARAVQPSAYLIRSNLHKYDEHSVNQRLLQTSNFEKHDLKSLVDSLTQNTPTETRIIYQSLCLMHDMLAAHAWVALVIYYRESHNFDIANMRPKADNENMYFFVNHPAMHMPSCSLSFVNNSTHTEAQLTELIKKRQIQSQPRIRYVDDRFVTPPYMSTANPHCFMHNAQSKFTRTVQQPFQQPLCVKITSFALEYVNMQALTQIIHDAAQEAFDEYSKSRKCARRNGLWRREYADINYFTRTEQEQILRVREGEVIMHWGRHINNRWTARTYTNFDNNSLSGLGFRRNKFSPSDRDDDFRIRGLELEFSQTPKEVQQQITTTSYDDIDLRMHYFKQAMKKHKWQQHIQGMWYLTDIHEFLQCVSNLKLNPHSTPSLQERYLVRRDLGNAPIRKLQAKDDELAWYCINPYRFKHDFHLPPPASSLFANSKSSHAYAAPQESEMFETCGEIRRNDALMPDLSLAEEERRMRFSIISAFFDCRDGGLCGYAWEDWVFRFWKDNHTDEVTGNHQEILRAMLQRSPTDDSGQARYFDNCWFRMLEGIEVEFRNMLSYGVKDLYQGTKRGGWKEWHKLEKKMHALLRTRPDALSVRKRTNGPRDTVPRLSVSNRSLLSHTNLPSLLLYRLHSDLPMLDEVLETYIDEWNCPDMYLWLQLAGIPNILALQQVGKQYIAGTCPESTTKYFKFLNTGTVSEIDAMLRYVANDKQVFVTRALPTPSKLVIMSQDLVTALYRQVLGLPGLDSRIHASQSIQTPLHYKFHMLLSGIDNKFTSLFGNNSFLKLGSCRPVIFTMLQVTMLQHVLTQSRRNALKKGDAFYNEYLLMLCQDEPEKHGELIGRRFIVNPILHSDPTDVYCTMGCSADTWPARDSNQIMFFPARTIYKTDELDVRCAYCHECRYMTNNMLPVCRCTKTMMFDLNQVELNVRDMKHDEKMKWELLMASRPTAAKNLNRFSHLKQSRKRLVKNLDTTSVRFTVNDETGSIKDLTETYIFLDQLTKEEMPPTQYANFTTSFTTKRLQSRTIWVKRDKTFEIGGKDCEFEGLDLTHVFFYDNVSSKFYVRRFVGVRCWAWKRLLVKTILLYTCSRALTHCRDLTGLFLPSDTTNQPHAANYEVFEEIEDKGPCSVTVLENDRVYAANNPTLLQAKSSILQQAVTYENQRRGVVKQRTSAIWSSTFATMFDLPIAIHEQPSAATTWPNVHVERNTKSVPRAIFPTPPRRKRKNASPRGRNTATTPRGRGRKQARSGSQTRQSQQTNKAKTAKTAKASRARSVPTRKPSPSQDDDAAAGRADADLNSMPTPYTPPTPAPSPRLSPRLSASRSRTPSDQAAALPRADGGSEEIPNQHEDRVPSPGQLTGKSQSPRDEAAASPPADEQIAEGAAEAGKDEEAGDANSSTSEPKVRRRLNPVSSSSSDASQSASQVKNAQDRSQHSPEASPQIQKSSDELRNPYICGRCHEIEEDDEDDGKMAECQNIRCYQRFHMKCLEQNERPTVKNVWSCPWCTSAALADTGQTGPRRSERASRNNTEDRRRARQDHTREVLSKKATMPSQRGEHYDATYYHNANAEAIDKRKNRKGTIDLSDEEYSDEEKPNTSDDEWIDDDSASSTVKDMIDQQARRLQGDSKGRRDHYEKAKLDINNEETDTRKNRKETIDLSDEESSDEEDEDTNDEDTSDVSSSSEEEGHMQALARIRAADEAKKKRNKEGYMKHLIKQRQKRKMLRKSFLFWKDLKKKNQRKDL